MILGSGAGGSTIGCLQAGYHVICVDSDPYQVGFLRGRLNRYAECPELPYGMRWPKAAKRKKVEGEEKAQPIIRELQYALGKASTGLLDNLSFIFPEKVEPFAKDEESSFASSSTSSTSSIQLSPLLLSVASALAMPQLSQGEQPTLNNNNNNNNSQQRDIKETQD